MRSARCGDKNEVLSTLNKACSAYNTLGYSSASFTDPSSLLFFSNVLSRNVQMFFCHGNPRDIVFEDTGLSVDGTGTRAMEFPEGDTKNIEFFSMYDVDWSSKKLVTLASCNSAGMGWDIVENDPYSGFGGIASQISAEGAQMTIGWYNKLNSESGPDWLDHFHAKLQTGARVSEAVNYANSKFYVYGNVRDNYYFYWSDTALTISESNSLSTNVLVKENENILKLNNNKNTYNVTQIENVIKLYDTNFETDNYEKQISSGGYSKNMSNGVVTKNNRYIDYIEKIGDFVTNSAYTVEIDENDNIVAVYDYTKNLNNNIRTTNNVEYTITDEQKNYYLELAKSNIANVNDIVSENIKFVYDLDESKKYVYIDIDLNDNYDVNNIFYKYEI